MSKCFFILLSILLVCFMLLSCQSKVIGHQIVGKWEHAGSIIEFCTNGYFKKGDQKYKYTVTEKNVTIDKNGKAVVVKYTINSNGTLTMNNLIYYPVRNK